jgi:hypothetical protein
VEEKEQELMRWNKEFRLTSGSGKQQNLLQHLILEERETHIRKKEGVVRNKMGSIDFTTCV